MILETVDRRVLGAVRPVDVNTGLRIETPLLVQSPGARFWRNRRGDYVIAAAAGLESHRRAFDAPPAQPAVESLELELTVRDPRQRFLPRRSRIKLPRDADPQHAAEPTSLFQAIGVPMFPAPAGQAAAGSAVIRASLVDGSGEAVPAALLRVIRTSDAAVLARGLSEWSGRTRGEAMVPVPGIPVTTWGAEADEVVVHTIAVTVEVIWDTAFDPRQGPPDPDQLESRPAGSHLATFPFDLAAGQVLTARLTLVD